MVGLAGVLVLDCHQPSPNHHVSGSGLMNQAESYPDEYQANTPNGCVDGIDGVNEVPMVPKLQVRFSKSTHLPVTQE